MRKLKILVPLFALVFLAAACNKQPQAPAEDTPGSEQSVTPAPPPTPAPSPAPTPAPAPTQTPQPKIVTVAITADGYSPSELTINKGDSVKFVNNDNRLHWPASAPHPTHTDYSEFDPKQGIAAGGSWAFTFDKTGTWKFHDHLNPARRGAITVE
ncbi:MAG: hypothetical protein A3H72_02400 [Candidatus Doudnabacteria bacterium RIFCSPLOWO2_02_FULL_48_8]|uniref:EfeO-type cupredoxin-like domain-containing protein n=1 Tax=Candidatus Doudnabacteria bacterium RIFCSPHIGHO2_01_FULL_46_24 TaxID=1817825 RepID=A0A1F5NSW6_9BACT|nr:MAG: hypothetical protein A2720_04330 [Candidatus Doudnabacteria bacterium RIFCSPHIGHO2_01_FULL_46_24]OGE94125.1 MAG: hypothetical protein A3E98_02620 [Candidatus Doudnabacteria bacterium RIFCSPHIGHO2_12_FULL_48_11]OGE95737.1 MAG: hypothetical protein A3H72_02400 [Candidatus Doudnabacteria bacterium RIFCSPLOWO2_02_FULL_48_8]